MPSDGALDELRAAGFDVYDDRGCSNSVAAGLVRQISYLEDGVKVVVVGKPSEARAPTAPVDAPLLVLVSTGPLTEVPGRLKPRLM
jgi:hypothetical protein